MTADPRFPIGRFQELADPSPEQRATWIEEIRRLPAQIRAAVQGLDDRQLDTPYRDGGWTVRQVVHHLPDSHVNAYVRFRLALTEEEPTIRPYDEKRWADLPDARRAPVELSLALLDSIHARWVVLLESMGPEEFGRPLIHPESGPQSLNRMLQLYAWHGRHHLAHVTGLRERAGWA
jgi:hypothetical protein